MHIVAIMNLGTTVEAEAKALAADLGTLPYEQRLKLVVGTPVVVLATPDADRAATLATALRARGHDVLRCHASEVVAMAAMMPVRKFRFDVDALVVATPLSAERLAWADIAVLVRGAHRTTVETQNAVKKRHLSISRTILTGGLMTSKTSSRAVVTHSDDVEGVLYVFSRTGGVPWILREQHAQYDVLGVAVAPSTALNFNLAVDMIRSSARGAAFDERLVARKGSPAEVDLLAHLIARSIQSNVNGPFR